MDSDSARHILQRRRPGGLKHIEIRCLALRQWIREKRLAVGREKTKRNIAYLFTKHLDGPRTRPLARKIGLQILGVTNDALRTALQVEQGCEYSRFQQLTTIHPHCSFFFSFFSFFSDNRSEVQYTVDSPFTLIWVETVLESGHISSEFIRNKRSCSVILHSYSSDNSGQRHPAQEFDPSVLFSSQSPHYSFFVPFFTAFSFLLMSRAIYDSHFFFSRAVPSC